MKTKLLLLAGLCCAALVRAQDYQELLREGNNDNQIYHHPYREECVYAYRYTGIEEIAGSKKITIYTTPDKWIRVDSDWEISIIQIYNSTGNKIAETKQKSIDLSGFSNGLYLIKVIFSNNNTETVKWIKQ
jgi:hypothetical protein